MNWLHNEKEVTEEMVPDGAVGFIYMIIHIPTGKYYIGKKSLESVRNVKIGVRELAKIKQERKAAGMGGRAPIKKKVRKSSDWEKYYSSNEWIIKQVKEGKETEFKREIIEFCYSKKALSYLEVYYQFKYNVLSNENSINENILGKFFKKDTLNTPKL
jgi:hypothetical protein